MRLEGRTAVITGAAQGIGRAIAERLILEGAFVLISDINAEKLASTASALDCASKVTNAAVKAEVAALVDDAVSRFGRLDIAVANAGIIHSAELLDLREEDFDRVM